MSQINILVVEDEAITAEVIAEQLIQLGYTVTDSVTSGTGAISSTANNQPDLVLMDITLDPNDIDGITAAQRIREQFQIPVVYLTAHSDETTLARAKMTAPFGYLIKPFNERELRVAIETALYRHQLEKELVKQQNLLATILSSTNDAVIASNETGAITYINPAAATLTGWTVAEASGQSITDVIQIVDELTNAPLQNPVMEVIQEERVIFRDQGIGLIAKDGSKIPVGNSASPITEEDGSIKGVVLVLWNISKQQKPELLAVERDKLLAKAGASIQAEAQAGQILSAVQELGALKSDLIARISHEFRTPLSIILTAAELLQKYGSKLSPHKQERNLYRIQSSVMRMTRIMEDVLTLSKAESGELQLNCVPVDVVEFCRSLVEEHQIMVGKRYTIGLIPQDSPGLVELDEQILRQILSNLLTLATHYSLKGSMIALEMFCEDNQIVFQVKDQGSGIVPESQGQLFEALFRASNIGSMSSSGMGLGMIRKFVDLHRGQITLTSQVGVGTTYTVKLPLTSSI
ncbi:hybrid sensor histidine kinase/response regulator [Moorena bouillonii]|uniref:histidine kinase n=1 Tax=Moorena bouillonii PNG TaxID=568701 RepID=A0A1U7MZZ1_9CYAN|nr:response regulator [Moorena bouillonii]OLT59268.1 hybrid sensor histidine kinase/response regulator [Moorena bouillonii PNG]